MKIVAVEENDDIKCNHDLEALPSCGATGRHKEIERKLWKEAMYMSPGVLFTRFRV